MFSFIKKLLRVFPGSLTVTTLHSQHRGYSFHPWLGNKDTACPEQVIEENVFSPLYVLACFVVD